MVSNTAVTIHRFSQQCLQWRHKGCRPLRLEQVQLQQHSVPQQTLERAKGWPERTYWGLLTPPAARGLASRFTRLSAPETRFRNFASSWRRDYCMVNSIPADAVTVLVARSRWCRLSWKKSECSKLWRCSICCHISAIEPSSSRCDRKYQTSCVHIGDGDKE
jgi:hypothetical protein